MLVAFKDAFGPRTKLAQKDRNLKIRTLTWIFNPAPWLLGVHVMH